MLNPGTINRRSFISRCLVGSGLAGLAGFKLSSNHSAAPGILMTVAGEIKADAAGFTLAHEHMLVDFIGADQYDPTRWDRKQVSASLLPYLKELSLLECRTIFEFTPSYLGRDPLLLSDLSKQSGMNIITNTGYYGAVDNKYLPKSAFEDSAEKISYTWINEFQHGIEETGIRPGFIKISVNPGSLSPLHRKIVKAAALTHLKTGLTVASHTGPAVAAFEQLSVLKESGVHPSAFIWVHAQNEKNRDTYVQAASSGAWISLDGCQESNVQQYKESVLWIKKQGILDNLLISQDAGWYDPGKPWNGPERKYTDILNFLIPELTAAGFKKKDLRKLFEINPARAFGIRIRRL